MPIGSTHYNVTILTRTRAVLKVDVPLLEGVAEIKFLGNASLKLVVDSMTALASVLALKAALGSVSLVLTEGARILQYGR